jgi:hypothetical protein
MIIYYPVTALVTLFANVLQNPQDARARSDIRLMHQVVSFLTSLAVDEETGGVKRMLDVCVEFERIAKIVLEKSDKESHSRRKRKNVMKEEEDFLPRQAPAMNTPPANSFTPKAQHTPAPSTGMTPLFNGDGSSTVSPNLSQNPLTPPSATTELGMLPEFVPRPGDFPNPFTEFSDMNQFGPGIGSPLNLGRLQNQFGMPDMWQNGMNFDQWDWNNIQDQTFAAAGVDGASLGVQNTGMP